jgi:hypothetical protein
MFWSSHQTSPRQLTRKIPKPELKLRGVLQAGDACEEGKGLGIGGVETRLI